MDIRGSVAVVTGAASGIGRAAALELAREGASLVLADLDGDGLREIASEIEALGRSALAVETDVAKLESVQNLFDRSLEGMGRVDILMNNAGVHIVGPIENTSIDDWKWIIDINLWGVIYGIKVFLPHMLERESGHIVNTASVAGLLGGVDAIPYTATKFAVLGISEGLAVALKRRGVGVTAVCPGLVGTNIIDSQRLVPSGDGLDQARETLFALFSSGFKEAKLPDFLAPGDDADMELRKIIKPVEVAEATVRAIKENTFLVLTHPAINEMIKARAEDMNGHVSALAQQGAEREQAFNQVLTQLAAAAKGGQETS
jgi:NAD(P)-dependent dehydrogenase (short-subunit alcohol dehydrogenase family)